MKKVTYSSWSIHGRARKNLYEEHVHVLLSLQTFQQRCFWQKKMSLKELVYLITKMYIIHAISHGFLALQSSNTITDIPTCTIIGPLKSLSNQEHASSNMAWWEQRSMLGMLSRCWRPFLLSFLFFYNLVLRHPLFWIFFIQLQQK